MKKRFFQRILILSVLVLLWSALVPCIASGQEDSILISPDPTILANSEAGSTGDYFGYGVAVDGNTLAVGAPYDDDKGDNSGCAYLFSRTSVEPFPQVKLTEKDDAQSNDYFGNSVNISGDTLVIGAYYKNVGNQSHSGAAYVVKYSYDESQDSWDTEAVELTGDPGDYAEFGYAVAISGDVVVIGAHQDSEKGYYSGAVYVFRNNGSTWIREAKLFSSAAQPQEYFGSSVALDGDTLAVGAIKGGDGNTGSVYVFRYNGPGWEEEDRLFGDDLGDGDKFGYSVALEGETIVAGAPYHDGVASNTGAAYVFRLNGETWIPEAKLTGSGLSQNDRFGNSVALSGDTAIVGASRYDLPREGEDIPLKDAGSAFLFRLDESGWNQTDKLIAPDAATQDEFGLAVAISGDIVLVGAYKRDNDEVDSGSAYVYTLVPENHPPVADAGENIEVEEGSQVRLVGSGYDPDFDNLEYLWTQIGEPVVSLDASNRADPTFTAPACPGENVKLKFQLVVYDGKDYSEPDGVEVTVLPSTTNVTEINAVLDWQSRPWRIDKDMYTFHGLQGEKVIVTLTAKTGGKNNNGDRATLKLKDNIRGVSFYRVDSSRLPNQISATLPATGQYHILVAGQRRFRKGKRFLGEYTLTLEGASGSVEKGAGTPVAHNKPGYSAKPHKQHPVWSWISSWFRH